MPPVKDKPKGPLGRDSEQATLPFATPATSAESRYKQIVEDGIYGELPDYKDNPDNWCNRVKSMMRVSKYFKRVELAPKDENTRIIIQDTFTHLEENGQLGDLDAAWKQLKKDIRFYVQRRRKARDDKKRQANEKAEIYEYGRSLRMRDANIAGVIAKITAGVGYSKRCHDALDAYRRDNPEVAPSGDFYNGTVPDTTGIPTSVEDFARRQATTPHVATDRDKEPNMNGLDELDRFLRTQDVAAENGDDWEVDEEQAELDSARPADIAIIARDSELDTAFPRISIGDYLALDKDKRPQVQYAGEDVLNVYLDKSYDDGKHYVILLDSYGAGSKLATTLMVVVKKEDKPKVDDPKTDELNERLNALAAQQSGDELTEPEYNWTLFWVSVRNLIAGNDLIIDDHHEYVHKFFDIPEGGSLKGKKDPNDMLRELSIHFSSLQSKNGLEDNQNNSPAIGVPNMQSEATSTQNSTVKSTENSQLPEAPFSANFKLTDSHGIEIQFTIRATSGKEGIPQINTAIEYLLANGYTTRQQAAQSLPSNATPIGNAPSAQSGDDSGKSDCYVIKVGRTFKNDKDQIVFMCNGIDEAKYSAKDMASMLKIVSGLRKADGSAITAADLFQGAMVPVKGKVNWKKTDDGKYINVLGTDAA